MRRVLLLFAFIVFTFGFCINVLATTDVGNDLSDYSANDGAIHGDGGWVCTPFSEARLTTLAEDVALLTSDYDSFQILGTLNIGSSDTEKLNINISTDIMFMGFDISDGDEIMVLQYDNEVWKNLGIQDVSNSQISIEIGDVTTFAFVEVGYDSTEITSPNVWIIVGLIALIFIAILACITKFKKNERL